MLPSRTPKVALVGRTNVGKSALFNRLVGRRKAIVEAVPGTTRDLISGIFEWAGRKIEIVDSGGLAAGDREDPEITEAIQRARTRLIKESDVILFVCDGKSSVLAPDEEIARALRHRTDDTLVIVNKVDHESQWATATAEFYRLGFQEVIPVSAAHGLGISVLCDKVVSLLPAQISGEPEETEDFSLAIIGEPNTGKSTYLNAILKSERATVSSIPGTTRDPVEDVLQMNGRKIRLMDTAGARRNRKVKESVAFYSQRRTLDTIEEADVLLLFFEAASGLSRNGLMLAEEVCRNHKSCVLVANKWDLVSGAEQGKYRAAFYEQFKFLSHCPLIFISAQNGKNIEKPLEEACRVWRAGNTRIEDRMLTETVTSIQKNTAFGERSRIKYATQVSVSPPHFVLFTNQASKIPENQLQAIRNALTVCLGLGGVFFKLSLRRGKKP
ncbi:MAG: ribosome biogenesis GTPase Der [Candidatus Omnitrophica bacterium]|nr:ribosome biogenesis GTPase Der [Candidatus Omnitrophota bacterium]